MRGETNFKGSDSSGSTVHSLYCDKHCHAFHNLHYHTWHHLTPRMVYNLICNLLISFWSLRGGYWLGSKSILWYFFLIQYTPLHFNHYNNINKGTKLERQNGAGRLLAVACVWIPRSVKCYNLSPITLKIYILLNHEPNFGISTM